MTETLTTKWGPLATPVHATAADETDITWKDNAYLSFWDVEGGVYGSFHVSTSPNDPQSRRARCSVQVGGQVVEVIEALPGGSFTGATISFGLDGTLTVVHPDLVVRLTNTPLWTPADYSLNELIPPVVPDKPLQHFQQGCDITGTIDVAGRRWPVSGHGMRDRTWGFRDEAAQWAEYAGIVGIVDGGFVTAMKFLGTNGVLKADGYWVNDDGPVLVTDIGFRRNAAAQFLSATLGLADGRTRSLSVTSRRAGFFVPMGRDTDGPAFGTYDDFMTLSTETGDGAGFFEQGIVHRVY